MAAYEIVIEVREDVSAALARLIDAATDLTPAMGDIAGNMADSIRERFETETSPAGVPWVKSKKDDGQTLTLHGHLRGSIREAWGADFAAAGPEASGPAAIYALIHQLGGIIKPKVKKALSFAGRIVASVKIPARPYVGWNDANSDYAVDALGDHLTRAFSASGASA